ncbi:PDZ domain-containing protein [Candidatus Pacearchaeota archaeon]|nr:PDZ domain-containing protein [Candidatus Pacearchaeota archaeon]
MSFVIYDLTFLVIFSLIVFIFLYRRRKNLKREGLMYLYRTQVGIKLINYIGKKYNKFLGFMDYVVIIAGYLMMAIGVWMFIQLLYIFIKLPDFVRMIKIPPIAPLIPYLPQIFNATWLPPFYFTYWIVAIAITAIIHEFSHGIFAKKEGVKIKTTGFAFLWGLGGIFLFFYNKFKKRVKPVYAVILSVIIIIILGGIITGSLWYLSLLGVPYMKEIGIILVLITLPFIGAFVEPDENQVKKMKIRKQLPFLIAGTFSNLIIAIIFFFIFWIFFSFAFVPSGVIFGSYTMAAINVSDITIVQDGFFVKFNGGLNLTEIEAENKTYFATSGMLAQNSSLIAVFEDSPALRAGLSGVITEFNGIKIKNNAELRSQILKMKPGDSVEIKTLFNNSIKEHNVILGKRPDNSSAAYLGIATSASSSSGIMGKIRDALSFFQDSQTYYQARWNEELVIFIYNLIWWIMIINISVAIFNMLPLGIFDGGRVFYLTALFFVKREETAKKIYKILTYIIVGIFLALTLLWLVYTIF